MVKNNDISILECIELRDYLRQSERNQHIQHITGIKLFLALKIHMIVIQDAPSVVQIWASFIKITLHASKSGHFFDWGIENEQNVKLERL